MKGFGVLLMALGKPRYGEMAYNIAMSIKYNSPSTQVCVIADDVSLAGLPSRSYFDSIIEMPSEYYIFDGSPHYYTAKLFLDLVTPFDTTLFLDVDMMLFDNFRPERFAQFLKEQPFQPMVTTAMDLEDAAVVASMGKTLTTQWHRRTDALKKRYALSGKMLMTNSSMLLWKKADGTETEDTVTAEDIFEVARWLRCDPEACKYTVVTGDMGDYPDEFFFNVALSYLNYKPKYRKFSPIFMDWLHTDKSRPAILEKYVGVNMNGFGALPYHLIDLYNFFVIKYTEYFEKKGFNNKLRKILWRQKQ